MYLTSQTGNKLAAVLFLSLGYASMDCMLPVAWALCLDVGGKYAGAVSGSMNMAGQVGSFATAVTFGYVVDATHSYNAPLAYMSLFLFVAAVLFARIDPTKHLIPDEGPAAMRQAA
jgi:nitrate/nitrite transporter NarK